MEGKEGKGTVCEMISCVFICAYQQRRPRGEHRLWRTCKGVWRRSMPCRCRCSWPSRRKSNIASVWSGHGITQNWTKIIFRTVFDFIIYKLRRNAAKNKHTKCNFGIKLVVCVCARVYSMCLGTRGDREKTEGAGLCAAFEWGRLWVDCEWQLSCCEPLLPWTKSCTHTIWTITWTQ